MTTTPHVDHGPDQGKQEGCPRKGARDARHVPLTRGQRLEQDAAEAAEVRAYQTHPDVVALRIERIRSQVDRLCWAGIVLGLAFTMTNVQVFAASGAAVWSLPWLAAWVLDPTVSLVLLAILRAEQVTARYQVHTGRWVRGAKWFTLAATYLMNTWQSWTVGSTAGVVLHSVPPLLVFVAAEAVTDLRDKLTDAVTVAVNARVNGAGIGTVSAPMGALTGVDAVSTAVRAADVRTATDANASDTTAVHGVHEPTSPANGPQPARRRTFAEYRAVACRAWSPSVEITPAWVRQVTGCSRGLSSRLSAVLVADVAECGHPRDGEGRP